MPNAAFGPDRFAPAAVHVERRADGTLVLRSPQPLGSGVRAVGEWLHRWAVERPEQTFLAERRGGDWYRLSYREALGLVRRVAQGLLDRGLDGGKPVMVLSGNSIEHALIALGAMHVGVPIVPVSTAYSLLSQDHSKLRAISECVRPALVYTADPTAYGKALQALRMDNTGFDALLAPEATTAVDEAFARVTPETVAKILFTSGSTGQPKGVINTQRMQTVNQLQSLAVWRFVADEPPVVVDWLPWNHTFGGNYNFNLVLANGGTMYIDGGKPVPGLFDETLRNLRDIAPTMYFNVPRGFDLLLPELERDAALRRHFFSRCTFAFYAGAALPQPLWDRLVALARQEGREDMAIVSSWGSTETAPLAAAVHYRVDRAGVVGLPVPGLELKLVPNFSKLEARVRGPNITPGYWRNEAASAEAFDEEGFYRMGDALRFVDALRPEAGLAFDGRVAEDFKLRSGTWVHVGALRLQLLAASDNLILDAVITGHDRDEVGALVFLHPAVQGNLPPDELQRRLQTALRAVCAANGAGSSGRIVRARVLDTPPQSDAGEITDKGYINQRAVLTMRSSDVERLYANPDDERNVALA